MKKIYFLSTCSTCSRIIKSLNLPSDFIYQDIKTNRITPAQLEEMKGMAGTYETLFSRRSMQYKALNLAGKSLTENDFKKLILEEYTFLKRPVFIVDNQIFIGNNKDTIAQLERFLGKKP